MSRIGKKPVSVPSGVTVNVDGQTVSAKGSKGELSVTLVNEVSVELADGEISVNPINNSKRARSMWGMSRTLIVNIIEGVTNGFTKTLEINGVGYRAQVQGSDLILSLGYSHEVRYNIPQGITIACPKPTEITISGIDKQEVGQVAANIRKWRLPEPYKGKGIRYQGEFIALKEGKKK